MKFIAVVRGTLKSTDEKQSQMTHDGTIDKVSPIGRSMGNIGHQAYLNTQNRREFLAIDTWDNIENMQKLFSDPNLAAEFAKLFDGQADITIWADAGWQSW
jgi:quinol monooxygenase YgiN